MLATSTWELIFRVSEHRDYVLAYLETLKVYLTPIRIDFMEEGDLVRVMIGDLDAFQRVYALANVCELHAIRCEIQTARHKASSELQDEQDYNEFTVEPG